MYGKRFYENQADSSALKFHDRTFSCARFIPDGPAYADIPQSMKSCVGFVIQLASDTVSGDEYMKAVYRYSPAHLWR